MFFQVIFQKIIKKALVFSLAFWPEISPCFRFPLVHSLGCLGLRPFILFAPGADQIPLQNDCKTPLGGYVGLCGVVLYSLRLCFG